MATSMTDRERTAGRLLKASAQHSHDPMVEIDWTEPLRDGVFFCPPHRVSLYGTPEWDRLTQDQRVTLSRHEVASLASVGIWFETILMQLLLRYAYDRDPTTQHVRYALTEIADECRHSVMFSTMIEKLGCPAYGVRRYEHELGRVLKTAMGGVPMFASILIAEEVLDTLQREAMADETIQPLTRQVSRIHVVEEARHVSYARDELVRLRSRISRPGLAAARLVIARSAHVVGTQLIHPAVYAPVGLDPAAGRRAARANPAHRETLRWAATRLVAFFTDLDLIAGPGQALWRRAGLI